MRLHVRHGLDTAGTGANNSDTVILPLLLLIVIRPSRGVDDFALELLHALDVRPLEVIQDPRAVEKDVASLFELADRRARCRICLLQLHQPFARLLLPVAADNLGVEGHVFAEPPDIAHFIQVLPDVWAVREEARPVGLDCIGNAEAQRQQASKRKVCYSFSVGI